MAQNKSEQNLVKSTGRGVLYITFAKGWFMLTGWALDPHPVNYIGSGECIPLSDHADFSDLIEYVKKAKPKKIYTVHGFGEFVRFLREKGFDAESLKEGSATKGTIDKELLTNYDLFSCG